MGYTYVPINGIYWGYNPFTNHLLEHPSRMDGFLVAIDAGGFQAAGEMRRSFCWENKHHPKMKQ